MQRARLALVACVALAALPACGSATTASTTQIQVVAGESFWGSVAAQLGGNQVAVASIVTDPNADPHEYESSTVDARAFAEANYIILNGAGYDDWGQKLLSANASSGRTVFTVAELLGKTAGDNPHFWYSPAYVERVADRITADYQRIDPSQSSYFASQRVAFETALGTYHKLITDIGSHFAGRRVAATEDIFVYLASALKLDLISPPDFMRAVAEGNEPPAQAVAAFTDQIQARSARVVVYNTQTVTAVTTNIKQLAGTAGLSIVGISETLQPPSASFQSWQVSQLRALQSALQSSSA